MKNKDKLINSIQKIRAKNNKYWMDLLRLDFKHAPKEASSTIKKINKLSFLKVFDGSGNSHLSTSFGEVFNSLNP